MLPASLLPTIDIPQHLYAAPYTIRTMRTYKTLLIWCCPSVAIERHTTRLQPSWLKTMDCFELCNRLWVAVVAFIRRFLHCPSHVLRKSVRLRTSASTLPTPAMDEDGEAHLTWALDRYQRTLRSNERSRAIDLFLFDRNRLEVEPGRTGWISRWLSLRTLAPAMNGIDPDSRVIFLDRSVKRRCSSCDA